MNKTIPTESQDAFIGSESAGKIFFGSRQIGKTTGLALNAVEIGIGNRTHGPIGVSAPTMGQGRRLLDRCREIAQEWVGDDELTSNTLAEFTLPNGTSIQYVPISDLYMGQESLGVSRADEFEYLAVDEIDYINSDAIDQIVDDWNNGDVRGLAFAGTAKTDSPNIQRIVKDDRWFSVYDTLANSDWVADDDLENQLKSVGPVQGTTEYKGFFVSDPAEDADVVNGKQT